MMKKLFLIMFIIFTLIISANSIAAPDTCYDNWNLCKLDCVGVNRDCEDVECEVCAAACDADRIICENSCFGAGEECSSSSDCCATASHCDTDLEGVGSNINGVKRCHADVNKCVMGSSGAEKPEWYAACLSDSNDYRECFPKSTDGTPDWGAPQLCDDSNQICVSGQPNAPAGDVLGVNIGCVNVCSPGDGCASDSDCCAAAPNCDWDMGDLSGAIVSRCHANNDKFVIGVLGSSLGAETADDALKCMSDTRYRVCYASTSSGGPHVEWGIRTDCTANQGPYVDGSGCPDLCVPENGVYASPGCCSGLGLYKTSNAATDLCCKTGWKAKYFGGEWFCDQHEDCYDSPVQSFLCSALSSSLQAFLADGYCI